MINIISRSVLEKKVRGPKKVVTNLMAGLDQIGFPYVLNRALDSTNMLWVHDDIQALSEIKNLPERVKVLMGPNLFINPEEIPSNLDLNRALYLQPSQEVANIWRTRGFNQTEIAVWPAGVDTDQFKPQNSTKNTVMIYFKMRQPSELEKVITEVKKYSPYKVFVYGDYKEDDFKKALAETKYIIWLGCPESQGLALLEALSMNIPILVVDEGKKEYGVKLTSAPYFSEQCGRKIESLDDFPAALSLFEKDWPTYAPRQFILQNLNLEKQAHEFLNFYQDHFGYSIDQGKHERLQNNKGWRNN